MERLDKGEEKKCSTGYDSLPAQEQGKWQRRFEEILRGKNIEKM